VEDVVYARKLGYEILRLYKATLYYQARPIFRKIVQLMCRDKIIYSGLPQNEADAEEYCKKVNSAMNYTGNAVVRPDDLVGTEKCDSL
jgi:hypothetical protein